MKAVFTTTATTISFVVLQTKSRHGRCLKAWSLDSGCWTLVATTWHRLKNHLTISSTVSLLNGRPGFRLPPSLFYTDLQWRGLQLRARRQRLFWVDATLQRGYELGKFHHLVQNLPLDHDQFQGWFRYFLHFLEHQKLFYMVHTPEHEHMSVLISMRIGCPRTTNDFALKVYLFQLKRQDLSCDIVKELFAKNTWHCCVTILNKHSLSCNEFCNQPASFSYIKKTKVWECFSLVQAATNNHRLVAGGCC